MVGCNGFCFTEENRPIPAEPFFAEIRLVETHFIPCDHVAFDVVVTPWLGVFITAQLVAPLIP